ncbi:MAG TPA: hypothetical protein VE010_16005 [Thermoanaerobaculia bacterium]|nr:hypothetical protein [Thermoanaerobaculia bacterium]
MAGQAWSINIVEGSPAFVPDVYPGNLTTLKAQQQDIVSWSNQTSDFHQPWQTDETFENPQAQLTGVIDPHDSSDGYAIPAGSPPFFIYYRCNLHPEEHGTIEVVA